MKSIVFLSGTRADFGKLKSLIQATHEDAGFDYHVFVTGMHLMDVYGKTVIEIEKAGFRNIYRAENFTSETTMDLTLAKTIQVFSDFISKTNPDLIVVHGDRVEALAGAIVGSLNNILIAHVEGGEISGTVDELIRHSVSKLSHIHFVSNEIAANRLQQMGELQSSIFQIGSPDLDILFSDKLPCVAESLSYYDIQFKKYAILLYHPVTTSKNNKVDSKNLVDAIMEDDTNYIIIYPNNDLGSSDILNEYARFRESANKHKIFPSIRFEHFITLLRNADFLIGNSSAGIHEAPYLGTPTINIGRRQENRDLKNLEIVHSGTSLQEIKAAIKKAKTLNLEPSPITVTKNAAVQFNNALNGTDLWKIDTQKQFRDL